MELKTTSWRLLPTLMFIKTTSHHLALKFLVETHSGRV